MDVIYWASAGRQAGPATVPRTERVAEELIEALLEGESGLRTGAKFKVGITGDPTQRSYGHGYLVLDQYDVGDIRHVKLQKGAWAYMHVIFQTSSLPAAQQAEFNLAEHARAWGGAVSQNQAPGGGGNFRPHGPYFVYLLQEKPSATRKPGGAAKGALTSAG